MSTVKSNPSHCRARRVCTLRIFRSCHVISYFITSSSKSDSTTEIVSIDLAPQSQLLRTRPNTQPQRKTNPPTTYATRNFVAVGVSFSMDEKENHTHKATNYRAARFVAHSELLRHTCFLLRDSSVLLVLFSFSPRQHPPSPLPFHHDTVPHAISTCTRQRETAETTHTTHDHTSLEQQDTPRRTHTQHTTNTHIPP